jgi:hypothetical protein
LSNNFKTLNQNIMRKLFVLPVLMLSLFIAKQAGAQSLGAGALFYEDAGYLSVPGSTYSINITSKQVLSATNTQTITSSLVGNIETSVGTAVPMTPIWYWQTPGPFTPLTLSGTSSNYIYITNKFASAYTYYIQVAANGTTVATGSSVSIPAGTTSKVYLPAFEATFTGALTVNSTYGYPTPLIITVLSNY